MLEGEIWKFGYTLAMADIEGYNKQFTQELLHTVARHQTSSLSKDRIKPIFVDCYKLLQTHYEKPNWILLNSTVQELLFTTYVNPAEQLLCAELIRVVVNHLGNIHIGEG